MTQEEKDIVLKDCNKKISEIESKKQENEHTWDEYYNKNFKVRFAIEDKMESFINSKIAGGTILVSSAAIFSASHSFALSIGVPIGGYVTITAASIAFNLLNDKKKREYWMKLEEHQKEQSRLDSECYLCRIISNYLLNGDKYLLQLYRENLGVTVHDGNNDEFWYLDFDTTTISPLLLKALEEIKKRSLELRNELRNEILADISCMQTQIAESTTISISELEEVQKMLKQHVPGAQALTK